ncbi:hypothetical protein CPC08DRAFT_243293 [Agrocybe pediades]|nr:hypothetical protein CPC08DRAFT_243293 [Agrocybe pediades]
MVTSPSLTYQFHIFELPTQRAPPSPFVYPTFRSTLVPLRLWTYKLRCLVQGVCQCCFNPDICTKPARWSLHGILDDAFSNQVVLVIIGKQSQAHFKGERICQHL